MAGMAPAGVMNQNYQRYKQGPPVPPQVDPPMGRAGYDEFGNPDPTQFTAAPRMHNSLSELALTQNPNLSADQMRQVNADWEKPELFEGEHAQRADFEQQLNNSPQGEYASQPGVLPMRNDPGVNASIGPMNGLDIAMPRDQNFFANMQYQNQGFQQEFMKRQQEQNAWTGFRDKMNKLAEENMKAGPSLEELISSYGKF